MDILKSGNICNYQYKKCGFVRNFTVEKKALIKIVSIIPVLPVFLPLKLDEMIMCRFSECIYPGPH